MARRVRGLLFADNVRMMRAAREVAWERHLPAQDLQWLSQRIEPDGWYPMDAYERMGAAVVEQIARGDMEAVRAWGRRSVDELRDKAPELIARDPREALLRFPILRQALFDFAVAEVVAIRDTGATVELRYGMSDRAEEAAAWQSIGFFERLLEVSGARNAAGVIEARSWEGAPATRIALTWA